MSNLIIKSNNDATTRLTLLSKSGNSWICENYNNGELFTIYPSSVSYAYMWIDKNGNGHIRNNFYINGYLFNQTGIYSGRIQDLDGGLLVLRGTDTSYNSLGVNPNEDDTYKKALLSKICSDSPDYAVNIIGRYWPNSYGFLFGNIYSTGLTNSAGLPQYSTMFGCNLNGTPIIFGTNNYQYYNYNILTGNNYNWYSPTLTGGGASGTWNINISGNAATASNANFLDSIDSTGFLRYYNANNAGLNNSDIVNTPSYLWTVSTTGGTITTSTKPSGMDNAWGVLHLHTHIGNYATQLGFGGTTGNLYFRNAYNSASFGEWKTLIHSGNIGSQSVSYANSAGNADTVDGYHAGSFTGQTHLGGIGDYQEAVIGLFPIATANNTGSANFASGRISCNRLNGLFPTYYVDFVMNDQYHGGGIANCIRQTNNIGGLTPCTFTYNGTRWAGFHQHIGSAQCNVNVFNGVSTYTPFMVVFYNHNDGSVYNSEIKNSLAYNTINESSTGFPAGITLNGGLWVDGSIYGPSLPGGSAGRIFFKI